MVKYSMTYSNAVKIEKNPIDSQLSTNPVLVEEWFNFGGKEDVTEATVMN